MQTTVDNSGKQQSEMTSPKTPKKIKIKPRREFSFNKEVEMKESINSDVKKSSPKEVFKNLRLKNRYQFNYDSNVRRNS